MRISLLTVMLLAPALGVAADESGFRVGTRVRITAPEIARRLTNPWDADRERLTGTVLALEGDRIVLSSKDGGEPVVVPRNAVTRVEISRGRLGVGKGALLGAAIGAAAGLAVSWAGRDDSPGSWSGAEVVLVPLGALLGGGFGAGRGASERWGATALPLGDERLRVSLLRGRGLGVSMALRF
jgi:hypothetical protein